MGIPAICGLGDSIRPEYAGRMAYIDGETGRLVIDPDEITLKGFQDKYQKQVEMKRLLQAMKGQEDVTLDGKHVNVYSIMMPISVSGLKGTPSSCSSCITLLQARRHSLISTRPTPTASGSASAASWGRI